MQTDKFINTSSALKVFLASDNINLLKSTIIWIFKKYNNTKNRLTALARK